MCLKMRVTRLNTDKDNDEAMNRQVSKLPSKGIYSRKTAKFPNYHQKVSIAAKIWLSLGLLNGLVCENRISLNPFVHHHLCFLKLPFWGDAPFSETPEIHHGSMAHLREIQL